MSSTPQQPRIGMQPIALVSQFRQQVLKMQHIDDVLLWMSHTMVNQWQLPLIQLWATQAYASGDLQLELRTVARQNPALPFKVHANQQVADVVKHLLREKRSVVPQPTANIFSSSQVEALAHYGLHYWAGYFVGNTQLLPPRKEAAREKIATPLCMLVSLFLAQPPSERLGRAINFTFQHGFVVAANYGLLTTPSDLVKPDVSVEESTLQHVQPDIATLIPHRAESIEEIRTGNPFANATILPDKKTRQVYSFVNDQRNIATIARLAKLDEKELVDVIRLLLQQQKIQLHDQGGNSINASLILEHS